MSPADPDAELNRLFEQLRRADEASAPAFQKSMAGAREKGHRFRWPRALVGAAIASAALAVCAAVVFLRRSPEPRLPAAAETLAAWRAPTDVFLKTPGVELLRGQPVLAPSLQNDLGLDRPRPSEKTKTAIPHS